MSEGQPVTDSQRVSDEELPTWLEAARRLGGFTALKCNADGLPLLDGRIYFGAAVFDLADARAELARERTAREAAEAEAYTIGMTCPVCKQYGDGCVCGGVEALQAALRAAERERDEAVKLAPPVEGV